MRHITVNTFKLGTTLDSVKKVIEEAHELEEAYLQYVDRNRSSESDYEYHTHMMLEIGDVLTATMNLCEKMGIRPQECVDMVETKNILRGYYDTIE